MERLRQKAAKAMTLEETVKDLHKEQRYLHGEIDALRHGMREATFKVAKFNWLLEQEVMLMTPDGVKYLKGEDLEKYIEDALPAERYDISSDMVEAAMARMQKGITKSMALGVADEASDAGDGFIYLTRGRYAWR